MRGRWDAGTKGKGGQRGTNVSAGAEDTAKESEQERVRRERAGTQRIVLAEEAYKVLQRIADEDCWLLGFDPSLGHPSWMILTVRYFASK